MTSSKSATTHKKSTKGGDNTERAARIGRALRVSRVNSGLSQRELGEAVGRSQNYIWLVESGRTDPGICFLADVATALSVPVELYLVAVLGAKPGTGAKPKKALEAGKQVLFELMDAIADLPQKESRVGRTSRKGKKKA